jgi:hypothetical protein
VNKKRAVIAKGALLIIGIAVGLVTFVKNIPFIRIESTWSIGIYEGATPVHFDPPEAIRNPVLTADQITDVAAQSVADPFMIKKDERWYMFFEIVRADTGQGDIGLAISDDGYHWTYSQVVLDEPFHLSYPYVFIWNDAYYMIPESGEAGSIRLYKAVDFPTEWAFEKTLLNGFYVDPSIVRFENYWWLFAVGEERDTLHLFYADDLDLSWTVHPQSPIVEGDLNISRPGGRVIVVGNHLIRYAQDGAPAYGNKVWAFEITELTPTSYREVQIEKPVLCPDWSGWNAHGMHQVDPHQISESLWLASVDGLSHNLLFGIPH